MRYLLRASPHLAHDFDPYQSPPCIIILPLNQTIFLRVVFCLFAAFYILVCIKYPPDIIYYTIVLF